ncbi:hypothetical protein KBA63_00155 [Candidatus Woesebacteria bacterium]|nr:hypothetical protein [Candidatus Woesebacteria bacterium]
MSNLQQLKEEARKGFDNLLVGGIFTTKERKEITKDFIDSLITKALEEGKAIGREEGSANTFYMEVKKHIEKFIPVALCVIGEAMADIDTKAIDAETEASFKDERYKVVGKFKIKKLSK